MKNIEIRDNMDRVGTYANAMSVIHTKEEFVMEYMYLNDYQGVGAIVARIVVTPNHFKRIIASLQDNLKKYEKNVGKINPATSPN